MTEGERDRLAHAIEDEADRQRRIPGCNRFVISGIRRSANIVREWSAESPWVSVEDRLPEDEKSVLVVDADGEISFGVCFLSSLKSKVDPERRWAVASYRTGNPTLWCPIPPLPTTEPTT